MPVRSYGPKPACATRKVYLPAGSAGIVKLPVSVAIVSDRVSVSTLISAIFAPGISAPDESATVPVTVPRSLCANRQSEQSSAQDSFLITLKSNYLLRILGLYQ